MAAGPLTELEPPRRLAARRLALLGALLGAFASAYLLVQYVGGPGICLTGSGCDEVRASAFAYPLGIPLPLIGIVFYVVAVALLLAGAGRATILGVSTTPLTVVWAALGLLAATALTAIEIFVIGALCSWCLVQAAGSLMLAGGAVGIARSAGEAPAPEEGRTARARRTAAARVDTARRGLNLFTALAAGTMALGLVILLAIPALDEPAQAGAPSDQADRPQLGSGPVEVAVFSDFQCPACAVAAPLVEQLGGEGQVTITYRYFPLTGIHPNAMGAAQAAEAAHRQGRFWEMHDLLFATQSSWADLPVATAGAAFQQLAGEAGVDIEQWRTDLATASSAVSADAAEAARLQLPGTPTIFVDGRLYNGPLSLDGLREAVADALRAGAG